MILKPVEEISGFGGYGPIEHHGCIHHILMESEELYILFHKELYLNFDEDDRFDAAFTYSRTPFRRCHFAVKVSFNERSTVKFLLSASYCFEYFFVY